MSQTMPLLALHGLYKIYKEGLIESVALRDASLTVQSGEFVAITGRSGAGKSTLLSLIGGLATPTAGQVLVKGADIARMGEAERASFRLKHIGIVYQQDNLIPFLTACENVEIPMQLAGFKDVTQRARRLLANVGLIERGDHRPGMLSGGERQRAAIAVALAAAPDLLLADELTGELDSATAAQIIALLDNLNKQRSLTIVVVTHNRAVAARARRQITIANGQLIEPQSEVLDA